MKWLEQELDWLKSYDHFEDLLEDKGHVLRKLDARKFLVAELKEMQEQLPDREELLTLLSSARYTGLLLNLSRWILSRGWQPFLDEKRVSKWVVVSNGFGAATRSHMGRLDGSFPARASDDQPSVY